MTKKLLFKILAIIMLFCAITVTIFALIALFKQDVATSRTLSMIATPLMFGGVFVFVLGFGKDKNAQP